MVKKKEARVAPDLIKQSDLRILGEEIPNFEAPWRRENRPRGGGTPTGTPPGTGIEMPLAEGYLDGVGGGDGRFIVLLL